MMPVTVHATVDPDNDIAECNDGNNSAAASEAIDCFMLI